MATEVFIPKLGMTMTQGTVAEWLVPDGGHVGKGTPVFRLETEKIEFQVEAEAAGIVRHLVPRGTTLEPGRVVAVILAQGEPIPEGLMSLGSAVVSGLGRGSPFASPIARRLARENTIDLASVSGSGPGGRIVEADVLAAVARGARSDQAATVLASPIARSLAAQLGLELSRVVGTGPGGRITKEDVEAAAAAPPSSGSASPEAPRHEPGTVIEMRGMRKVIAERMHASLQEMAQLTLGMEVEMDEAAKLRSQLIAEWEADNVRPSFTDLILRAAAKALRRHPLLNAEVTAAGVELRPEINIGLAVALDNGLVVPVIRHALSLSLQELAVESARLASAARAGTLGPDDYAGSTFSVTNLGTSDVDYFTPIINPPNVAILGVGRIRDGVAWHGDVPARVRQLTLSLTIDHRAVDGAPGAAYLREVRDLLQAPYRLLL